MKHLFITFLFIFTFSLQGNTIVENESQFQSSTTFRLLPDVIPLNTNSVTAVAYVDYIDIHPTAEGYSSCQITPDLPVGLTLSVSKCTITGRVSSSLITTSYILSSSSQNSEAIFTLSASECDNNIIRIRHDGRDSTSTQMTLTLYGASVALLTITGANSLLDHRICTAESSFELVVDSDRGYWNEGAYAVVDSFISDDIWDPILSVVYNINYANIKSFSFDIGPIIPLNVDWYYILNKIPQNWYSPTTFGWGSARLNAISGNTGYNRLFKYIFSLSSTAGISGLMLHLQYQSGIVLYLNSQEVWRHRVVGEIATSNKATGSYTTITFHTVSIPLLSSTLVVGNNVLAVDVVMEDNRFPTSNFDCTARLMYEQEKVRMVNWSIEADGLHSSSTHRNVANTLLYPYPLVTIEGDAPYDSNHIEYVSSTDGFESVNAMIIHISPNDYSIAPTNLIVYGKLIGASSWTRIADITGLVWREKEVEKEIFFSNSYSYSTYRIENIYNRQKTAWRFEFIRFVHDIVYDAISFAYNTATATVYKKNYILPLILHSTQLYNFTITPALPATLFFDTATGTVSGIAENDSSDITYTVAATKENTQYSTTLRLITSECSSSSSVLPILITFPSGVLSIFKGRGTSSNKILEQDLSSSAYLLFCLPHDVYTIKITTTNGWDSPNGIELGVDGGAFLYEQGVIAKGKATSGEWTVSTLLPFARGLGEWRYSTQRYENWKEPSYSDTEWKTVVPGYSGDIGRFSSFIYFRKAFTISNMNDYHTLHIYLLCNVGILVYLNGNSIASYNVHPNYKDQHYATSYYDPPVSYRLSVLLTISGATDGENIIAVQLVPSKNQTASTLFTATAVFGMEVCSTLSHSIIPVENLSPKVIDPLIETSSVYDKTYTSIEWKESNNYGIRFNSISSYFMSDDQRISYTFEGRSRENDDWVMLKRMTSVQLRSQERTHRSVNKGMIGYQYYRFTLSSPLAYAVTVQSVLFEYCDESKDCAAVMDYSAVENGEESASSCPLGYQGYSYRLCENGKWGEVQLDRCILRAPTSLSYSVDTIVMVKDIQSISLEPAVDGAVSSYTLVESTLPNGLVLNPITGVFEGKPTSVDSRKVRIRGTNNAGTCDTEVVVTVRNAICAKSAMYEEGQYGEEKSFDCAKKGNYVGSVKIRCELGKTDGEWKEISGTCVSLLLVFILCIVVVLGIIIAVILLLCCCCQSKKSKESHSPAKVVNEDLQQQQNPKGEIEMTTMGVAPEYEESSGPVIGMDTIPMQYEEDLNPSPPYMEDMSQSQYMNSLNGSQYVSLKQPYAEEPMNQGTASLTQLSTSNGHLTTSISARSLTPRNNAGRTITIPHSINTSISPLQLNTSISAPRSIPMQSMTPRSINTSMATPRNLNVSVATPRNLNTSVATPRGVTMQTLTPHNLNTPISTPRGLLTPPPQHSVLMQSQTISTPRNQSIMQSSNLSRSISLQSLPIRNLNVSVSTTPRGLSSIQPVSTPRSLNRSMTPRGVATHSISTPRNVVSTSVTTPRNVQTPRGMSHNLNSSGLQESRVRHMIVSEN